MELLNLIFTLIPLVLLVFALSIGAIVQSLHYKSLRRREEEVADIVATNLKSFPFGTEGKPPTLVTAEVVLAADHFRTFIAKLKKIIGGELGIYRHLMVRARREAMLRLAEQAQRQGYSGICNIRIETADVGGSTSSKKGATIVAILAFATAYDAQP